MKKLLALVLAVVMCTAALLTFASAEEFTPVTYDFVANFLDLEGTNFGFGARKIGEEGVREEIVLGADYYDGTDASIKTASHGNALKGYRSKIGGAVDVCAQGSDIVWYPAGGVENIIVFTAPEAGVYAFDFECYSFWGATHSTYRVYVEANGEVIGEKEFDKGTAKADTNMNFEGSVTLMAGETIYFVADPQDSMSSDNGAITKLQVTLTEKVTPPTPETNDALVAVIALAAVAGTALVISKKH